MIYESVSKPKPCVDVHATSILQALELSSEFSWDPIFFCNVAVHAIF